MQISHTDAQVFLQRRADHLLDRTTEQDLNEHLNTCATCHNYASQLNEIENAVHSIMHRRWNQLSPPLAMDALLKKSNQAKARLLVIMRMSMVGAAVLLFVFMGWQFSSSRILTNNQMPYSALPVPTPSTIHTATLQSATDCSQIRYTVQDQDTLEIIADQFSTTREGILSLNQLDHENIHTGMLLLVPDCNATPTGTILPPTVTLTPEHNRSTNTPG